LNTKQPYTDQYLRERVSKVIQAQKKGKILVAAYKDGTGLPTREDLSDLRYAANLHPHSYIVGNSGFLDYESDLGMYSFFPKGNQALPAVLRNQKPLALGEAFLNLVTRTAEIQVGDTLITFTGVPVWNAGTQILTELNEELSRKNTGVIVWKITYQESKAPVERLYSGAVPTLANAHTLGHLSGYAFDRENYLVYAGVTGYKTSLESLRATLITHKPLNMQFPDQHTYQMLLPLERYEHLLHPMPDYTSHHAAFVARQAIPGKWEPEDLCAYVLVFRGELDPQAAARMALIKRLKEAVEIPILDEWASVLWDAAAKHKYLEKLTIGGDCSFGCRLALSGPADWKGLIEQLLTERAIVL